MKSLSMITVLWIAASNAHAVQTQHCAETLQLETSRFEVLTLDEARKVAQFSFENDQDETFARHAKEVEGDLRAAAGESSGISATLKLSSEKTSGVCLYGARGIQAELRSKAGRDFFMISLSHGGEQFGTLFATAALESEVYIAKPESAKISGEYGEIGDDGRSGDFFRTTLARLNQVSLRR